MRRLRGLFLVLAVCGGGCESSKDFWRPATATNLHDNWAQATPGQRPPKAK